MHYNLDFQKFFWTQSLYHKLGLNFDIQCHSCILTCTRILHVHMLLLKLIPKYTPKLRIHMYDPTFK
jgi:hypothetical protein